MIGYSTDDRAVALSRETVYRFLAAMFRHPSESLREFRSNVAQDALQTALDILREDVSHNDIPLGFGELPSNELNAQELIDWLQRPPDDLFAEYDRVFGVGPTADCPPYETEFCPSHEPFYRAQQMADVAGFYHAFGLNVSQTRPDRPDHIALELEFMSLLVAKQQLTQKNRRRHAKGRAEVCRKAQRCFLMDHLVWWAPSFARGLRRKAGTGPYAALAQLLAAFMPLERSRFNIKAPQAPVKPKSVERPEEDTGCNSCTSTTS